MGEFFESFKNEARELLQNEQVLGLAKKKHLVSILILGILILAIPIGMELLKNQRIIRSRASGDPIAFVESDDVFQKEGKWFTKSKSFSVQITSPLGPAGNTGGSSPVPTSPSETTVPSNSTVANLDYTCSSDNSKVNLSWNVVSGVTGYALTLNRIDGPAPDWFPAGNDRSSTADRVISVDNVTAGSGGQVSVTNLNIDPGKEYSWTVQVNGQSNKVFGPNFKCGNASSVSLTAPTNITQVCNGTNATFSWTTGSGASNYALRLNKEPYTDWMGPGDEMQGVSATSLSLPIVPNAKYQWRVSSVASGKEESSPEVIFECPGTYNTPVLVGRCDKGVNLKLAWSSVAGAAKYLLRIDDTVNGWGGYDIQTGDMMEDNLTTTSYTSDKGQAGHSYQVWAHSADSSNNLSPVSNKVTVSCK